MKSIKLKRKVVISMLCALVMLFSWTSAFASDNISTQAYEDVNQFSHITDDILNGFEGLEVTTLGRVGYNYALALPQNKNLLLGFDPNMAGNKSYYNSVYDIGAGWKIKTPHIEISDDYVFLHTEDGKKYSIILNNDMSAGTVVDYPGITTLLVVDDNGEKNYLFEETYGSKYYFSLNGNILKTVDEFGNIDSYSYLNGVLSQITFSDGSSILLQRVQNKNENVIHVNYYEGTKSTLIATLNLTPDSNNSMVLTSIQHHRKGSTSFEYYLLNKKGIMLLSSFSIPQKYDRLINYENTQTGERIISLETTYAEGDIVEKRYFYDETGRLKRRIDSETVGVNYDYSFDSDGNLTVMSNTNVLGEMSTISETFDVNGRLIGYADFGGTLELKYNRHNQLIEEVEGDLRISYTYSDDGVLESIDFSDGTHIEIDHYPDGTIKKKIINGSEVYYTPDGQIQSSALINSNISPSSLNANLGTQSIASAPTLAGVSVLYNINAEVAVTDFHTYYGVTQAGFNCYTFSLGNYSESQDPGYYSNNGIDMSSATGIRASVHADQTSLGRSSYNTTLTGAIPNGHSWKTVLKIRVDFDYHFMKTNYGTSQPWMFKAGLGGPVMQLRGSYTPSSASWDLYIYDLWRGQYIVEWPGAYNSSLYYIMIED